MTKRTDAWFPFDGGAYLRDTLHLTTEQHGAYLLLLIAAWPLNGELPNDDEQLAAICRLPLPTWKRYRSVLLKFFDVTPESITQKRVKLERERADLVSKKRQVSGAKGASKRWQDNSKCHVDAMAEPQQNDRPPPPQSQKQDQNHSSSQPPILITAKPGGETPRTPGGWLQFFNENYRTTYGLQDRMRGRTATILQRWCAAGVTVEQVGTAVTEAQTTATGPINDLIAYTDAVLTSIGTRKNGAAAERANVIAALTGAGKHQEAEHGRVIDVTAATTATVVAG